MRNGVIVLDLRGTLFFDGLKDTTKKSNEPINLAEYFTQGVDPYENPSRFQNYGYFVTGGAKTVAQINQLRENGYYIAIATGDGDLMLDEIQKGLQDNGITVDLIYNWCRLAEDKAITTSHKDYTAQLEHVKKAKHNDITKQKISDQAVSQYALAQIAHQRYRKPDFYAHIAEKAGVTNYDDIYIFDDAFASKNNSSGSTMLAYAKEKGFKNLYTVEDTQPDALQGPLDEILAKNEAKQTIGQASLDAKQEAAYMPASSLADDFKCHISLLLKPERLQARQQLNRPDLTTSEHWDLLSDQRKEEIYTHYQSTLTNNVNAAGNSSSLFPLAQQQQTGTAQAEQQAEVDEKSKCVIA